MYTKSKINLEAVEIVSTTRSSEVKLVLCHHVKLHYVKKIGKNMLCLLAKAMLCIRNCNLILSVGIVLLPPLFSF